MNDNDEHDDNCVEVEVSAPAYPFSPWGTAYEIVAFAGALFSTVATFLSRMGQDIAAHNNYAIQQRKKAEGQKSILDDIAAFEKGERP